MLDIILQRSHNQLPFKKLDNYFSQKLDISKMKINNYTHINDIDQESTTTKDNPETLPRKEISKNHFHNKMR